MTIGAPLTEIAASRKTAVRHRGYLDDYRPQQKTIALLNDVSALLGRYREYWPLTVRQLFYGLVGMHDYPKTEAFYGKLCHHVANARRGRVIPFDAIRDDSAAVMRVEHFDDLEHFDTYINRIKRSYRKNLLTNQPHHLEVWCEAAGMLPQLSRVANQYSVQVYSCSGFDSLTAKKSLADRIVSISKPTAILHLGDYDPSGEAIFTAIAEDVQAFVTSDRYDARAGVSFERVALTGAQVRRYTLPTAPAKASDSRSKTWTGGTCQLEALPPDQIAALLDAAIAIYIDEQQLAEDIAAEAWEQQQIAYALPAPEEGQR